MITGDTPGVSPVIMRDRQPSGGVGVGSGWPGRTTTCLGQAEPVTVTQQHVAAERAGVRLALGLLGALVVVVATVPLAVLIRADNPGLVEADLEVSRTAQEATAANDLLLAVAKGVTLLGEPVLLTIAAALLIAVLFRKGHRRLAAFVLVARVGAMLLSTGLKLAVDRTRPIFDEPIATALGASFPSGHALGSAAFYATLAVLLLPRRAPLVVAALLAAAVAASRVLLGVHFPSDVTAGLMIGWGWVALCAAVFAVWRREQGASGDVVHEGIE